MLFFVTNQIIPYRLFLIKPRTTKDRSGLSLNRTVFIILMGTSGGLNHEVLNPPPPRRRISPITLIQKNTSQLVSLTQAHMHFSLNYTALNYTIGLGSVLLSPWEPYPIANGGIQNTSI